MNLRSIPALLISLLTISILFSQCQSSKIAFGNKYYFKQTPRTVEAATVESKRETAPESIVSQGFHEEDMLTASVQRDVLPVNTTEAQLEDARKQLAENLDAGEVARLKQKAEKINQLAMSAQDKKVERSERRAARKEMKQEMKELVKEYNAIKSTKDSSFLDDLDDNLRKAIIFWGIGVIFSILSAFVPFIWILASVSYLVGTVFFILWLVEELD